MAGDKTRAAIAAQPGWLARVPTDRRIPEGARVAVVGCGTSLHAAQTSGNGIDALEFVLRPADIDMLVLVSHEGPTPLTLEAAQLFAGPRWLVTGNPDNAIAALCDEVVVATPELEVSYCHTASYTCAVAALAALRGEEIAWLPDAVAAALDAEPLPVSDHERFLVVGAGRDWPTAQEAALKLREGVHVATEAFTTEELLHGHLAAIDDRVRCFVLEGEGRAAARAADAVAGLRELGCDVTLVPTSHPVVDIVAFQRLTVDLADARGVDPDFIRWDDPRWLRARESYK
ncbi:MAG: SIS domain-containing protein [Actinobacteria bacterium]|nr:SIS domain-containing protein [Actinomycetota bacterium]